MLLSEVSTEFRQGRLRTVLRWWRRTAYGWHLLTEQVF